MRSLHRLVRRLTLCAASLLPATFIILAPGCAHPKAAEPDAAPVAEVDATPAAPAVPYDREKSLESFETVWRTVKEKHWDLSGVDWDAVHDELRPKAEAATTIDEMRAVMRDMLSRLNQSHFAVWPREIYVKDAPSRKTAKAEAASPAQTPSSQPPSSETAQSTEAAQAAGAASAPEPDDEPEEITASGPDDRGYLGLEVRVRDDQALVTRVREGSPAEAAGIRPGFLVTSAAGQKIDRLLSRLDDPRLRSLPRELVLTSLVMHLFTGEVGQTIELEVVDGSGATLTKSVTLAEPAGTPVTLGNMPVFYMTIDSRRLPENVQYFAFSMFMDPLRLMAAFQKAVEEAKTAEGFIIDLRGNPGGIGGLAMAMGGWLVQDDDVKLGTMTSRDSTINFVINPRLRGYTGPVAILIDALSGSTSEIFAGGMQDIGRARVFGERSAGAALPSVFEELPNGDRFQYAIANYVSASGRPLEGEGVTPDEVVTSDRALLLEGRDAVIEAAVRWIKRGAPMERANATGDDSAGTN